MPSRATWPGRPRSPERFARLFGSGLDKRRHPELHAAAQAVLALLLEPARRLAAGDEHAALALATPWAVVWRGARLLRGRRALADADR